MASELYTRIADRLQWPATYTPDYRDLDIIAHYEREVSRAHIDFHTAIDRAIGDIKGQNRHPAKDQRS